MKAYLTRRPVGDSYTYTDQRLTSEGYRDLAIAARFSAWDLQRLFQRGAPQHNYSMQPVPSLHVAVFTDHIPQPCDFQALPYTSDSHRLQLSSGQHQSAESLWSTAI